MDNVCMHTNVMLWSRNRIFKVKREINVKVYYVFAVWGSWLWTNVGV